MERVSTNYISQHSVTRVNKSASDVFKSDLQVATGLKAQNFSEVASDLSQILTVGEASQKLEAYGKNMSIVESQLTAVESSIQSMQTILTEATSLATLALNENTPADRASLAATAEGLAKNLESLMNQKFQGKYIFSGQATNVAPVGTPSSPQVFAGTPANTLYYEADTDKLTTIISENTVIEYGVTGDDQAFADLKAGIEALWYGLENDDKASLKGSLELVNNAQTGFGSMLGNVGGEMKQIDVLQEQNVNAKDFLTKQLEELQGVDSTKAISELQQNQAVLEANLLLISKIGQISLIKYL